MPLNFTSKVAPSLGPMFEALLDRIGSVLMELGKCVVEKQSGGTTTRTVSANM